MTCMDCKHFYKKISVEENNYIGICLKTDKQVLKCGITSDGISCKNYKKRKGISGIVEDILKEEQYQNIGGENKWK